VTLGRAVYGYDDAMAVKEVGDGQYVDIPSWLGRSSSSRTTGALVPTSETEKCNLFR
jgi:hypothetical protein